MFTKIFIHKQGSQRHETPNYMGLIQLTCHRHYREHATNRAHLTLIFCFFEVSPTIFQFWYLNKINGSLNTSVEK